MIAFLRVTGGSAGRDVTWWASGGVGLGCGAVCCSLVRGIKFRRVEGKRGFSFIHNRLGWIVGISAITFFACSEISCSGFPIYWVDIRAIRLVVISWMDRCVCNGEDSSLTTTGMPEKVRLISFGSFCSFSEINLGTTTDSTVFKTISNLREGAVVNSVSSS